MAVLVQAVAEAAAVEQCIRVEEEAVVVHCIQIEVVERTMCTPAGVVIGAEEVEAEMCIQAVVVIVEEEHHHCMRRIHADQIRMHHYHHYFRTGAPCHVCSRPASCQMPKLQRLHQPPKASPLLLRWLLLC